MVPMLMELTRIVLDCAITFGPVLALLSLLNRLDRRTSQRDPGGEAAARRLCLPY
jgi:hypothetical protein